MPTGPDRELWWPRPVALVSGALLLVGLIVSTVATSLALDAGELPVTVLPFGRLLAGYGLVALVVARLGSVVVVWLVTVRMGARFRYGVVSGAGLFWLLWGIWQGWVLLART